MNKLALVVLCYIVNASNGYADILNPTADKILSKYPSLELGQAILLFMPEKGDDITWSYRVDTPVLWITNGYESNGIYAYRNGLIRINVQGVKSHVLKDNKYELPWTVNYGTYSNQKFGVESISLFPGIEPNEKCFGTLYDGCTFNVEKSMSDAGIKAKKICQNDKSGHEVIGYELHSSNKLKTFARLDHNSGTGGENSSFYLVFS
jgi:hypothetical protein